MASALLFFLFLPIAAASGTLLSQSDEAGYISSFVSESGLVFAKDLLVERAVDSLTLLRLPDIEKDVRIPVVGVVHMVASNITLSSINVSSSTVKPGESGIVIVASGASASLSFDWFYSYSTWLVPIKVSDKGTASVQVEGLQVGLTITLDNKNGTLELAVLQCGCYMESLVITLDGGASWFYQGFIYAFANHIRSSVEDEIIKKITEGAQKLDLFLQTLPKEIDVDKISSLNVTFVDEPILTNSSLELDINGLFIPSNKTYAQNYLYKAGLLHWMVNKVPEQSLLNTTSWKYLIPQLYRKYPNDDMILNMSLMSPPDVWITSQKVGANLLLDMTVNVLDGSSTIPVACISMVIKFLLHARPHCIQSKIQVVDVSGVVAISGNNLVGEVGLDSFSLSLKWSDVGKFHMNLIQGVLQVFLKTVFVPYVNVHLRQGFPLPIVRGFALQNASILTTSSAVVVCSDVVFINSTGLHSSL